MPSLKSIEFWLSLNLIAVGIWLSIGENSLFESTPSFQLFVLILNQFISNIWDELVVSLIFIISGCLGIAAAYLKVIIRIIIYGWLVNLYLLLFLSSIYPNVQVSFNVATYLVLSGASICSLLRIGK